MRHFFSILIILFATSCSTGTSKVVKEKISPIDSIPLPKDSFAFFFRTKVNWRDTTNNALDTFVTRWFSKQLFALHEPILNNYNGDKEIYRFTWLRTFHNPIAIRLEKQNNVIELFIKKCNGAGGYEPGQLILNTSIEITPENYAILLSKIEEANFWSLPTENHNNQGNDGSEWILEAYKNKIYHLVVRWTPLDEKYKEFRAIGKYLISLSKIKIRKNDFY